MLKAKNSNNAFMLISAFWWLSRYYIMITFPRQRWTLTFMKFSLGIRRNIKLSDYRFIKQEKKERTSTKFTDGSQETAAYIDSGWVPAQSFDIRVSEIF